MCAYVRACVCVREREKERDRRRRSREIHGITNTSGSAHIGRDNDLSSSEHGASGTNSRTLVTAMASRASAWTKKRKGAPHHDEKNKNNTRKVRNRGGGRWSFADIKNGPIDQETELGTRENSKTKKMGCAGQGKVKHGTATPPPPSPNSHT